MKEEDIHSHANTVKRVRAQLVEQCLHEYETKTGYSTTIGGLVRNLLSYGVSEKEIMHYASPKDKKEAKRVLNQLRSEGMTSRLPAEYPIDPEVEQSTKQSYPPSG